MFSLPSGATTDYSYSIKPYPIGLSHCTRLLAAQTARIGLICEATRIATEVHKVGILDTLGLGGLGLALRLIEGY